MADVEKLGKLRAKLKEITELIDNADQRKVDAKHSTVNALARLEKNEVEMQSCRRRIQLIEKDLVDSNDRLEVADSKLKTATDTSNEVEQARDDLESKENEDDETIQKIEDQEKELKRKLELNETKYIEADRKATVVKHDIERVMEKAETFEKRVAVLEEIIQNHGKSLEELEAKEGAAGEREELNEEKLRFLEGQLKETTVRAEAAERGTAVAERNILETENEINSWIQKREEIEREMIAMDDVADDPAYKFEGSRPVPKSDGYQSDDGRVTPGKLKKLGEMFDKQHSGSEDNSRPSSRASSKLPPEPTPEPTPPASEPEEEEEDFFGKKSSGQDSASASEKGSVKGSEQVKQSTEEEEESEEESDDDDYFK